MHISPFGRLGLIGALLSLAPAKAAAQNLGRITSGFDVGASMQREGVDLWRRSTRLAPSMRLDQPWMRFALDGAMEGSGRNGLLDRGTADIALSPSAIGPLRFSVSGRAERFASAPYSSRSELSMESALSLSFGSSGAWVGVGVERPTPPDSSVTRSLLRTGVWRQFGSMIVSISTASHAARLGGRASTITVIQRTDSIYNDTLKVYTTYSTSRTFGDSARASHARLWSQFELQASWARGAVALNASVGARPAVDVYPRAFWGRVEAAVQVTPSIAMIASGANDPVRIAFGTPQTRVATLGVRVSSATPLRRALPAPIRPSAAAFAMRSLGGSSYLISIRVPSARTVELSGDFGKWKPIALEQTRPDVWDAVLSLPPGTYRMNIRVDGDQWRAPPGMATVADEFNGTVGLLVVR